MTTPTENPKEAAGRAKCPLHLNPPTALRQMAEALQHGALKYGEWNWRAAGINATTYIAAAMRHLTAWQDGEDNDSSGLSHIAHAMAGMAIVLDAQACGMMNDDRSKLSKRPMSHEEIIAILGPVEDVPPPVDHLTHALARHGLPPAPTPPQHYRWVIRGEDWSPSRSALFTFHTMSGWEPTMIGTPTVKGNVFYLEAVSEEYLDSLRGNLEAIV